MTVCGSAASRRAEQTRNGNAPRTALGVVTSSAAAAVVAGSPWWSARTCRPFSGHRCQASAVSYGCLPLVSRVDVHPSYRSWGEQETPTVVRDLLRLGAAAHHADPMAVPEIPYWHVWRDGQGISRQRRASLRSSTFHALSEGSARRWQCDGGTPRTVIFLTLSPGEDSSWHENPQPQWIVPISGRWFVETMDGMRVEMGPGELSFGGDQGCQWVDGKRGHRSGALGNEPTVLMLIQVESAPVN